MPDNQGPKITRTRAGEAGQPRTGDNAPAAANAAPSDAELDLRDRMKVGPRRAAGPPLEGDTAEPRPMEALASGPAEQPTDPAGQ